MQNMPLVYKKLNKILNFKNINSHIFDLYNKIISKEIKYDKIHIYSYIDNHMPSCVCNVIKIKVEYKGRVYTYSNSCDQFCPTLCSLIDYSLPGTSVHGLVQARILEWIAISSSRGSSQPRDQTRVSCVSCIGRQILYH